MHDLTAARTHGVLAVVARAEVELYADKGYQGAGGTVTTAHQSRTLPKKSKARNRVINQLRGPGKRGFTTLKNWRIFPRPAAAHAASAYSPTPYSPSNPAP